MNSVDTLPRNGGGNTELSLAMPEKCNDYVRAVGAKWLRSAWVLKKYMI